MKHFLKRVINNDYAYSLVNKFLTVIIGVVSTACINRYLGPELKGEDAYIINIVNIIVLVTNFGFYQSYPNQHRVHMIDQKQKYTDIFVAQFIIYLFISIAIGVFSRDFMIGMASLLVPIQVLTNQLAMVALIEFIKYRQTLQIIMLFFNCVLNAVLLLFFNTSLLLAFLVLILKDAGFIVGYLIKLSYKPRLFSIEMRFVKYLLGFGMYAMISAVLLQLNYKLDILFLGNMVPKYSVGLYSVGVALAEYIWLIPDAFKEVLFAHTAKKDSVSEINTGIKINLYICLMIIIGMFLFGRQIIILLYGIEYADSFSVTCLIFLGIPPMIVFKLTNPLYLANGKQKFYCLTLLISVSINALLNWLLIPKFEMYGAAIATIFSYSTCGIMFYLKYIHDYSVKWYEPFVLTRCDITRLKHTISRIRSK